MIFARLGALIGCLCGLLATARADERPNVVVIMVDDLGYSDIGCYGGEIETPNLDALAAGGLRFSQFYNTAKCHSSRVSLLTGQYCIAAGDTALSHAVTSAEVLGNAGYFTAMTGKWHLKDQPTDFGFDRYFGHLSGACNFFHGDNSFRLNGQPWKVPESDFYTTVADVDFALDFLEESRRSQKPFYLYVAFNAPHAPLHALPEDYAKYKGRYDAGWDEVRDARIAKQKSLGLLPKDLTPSPRPDHVRAWDQLVSWQRDYEINRMVTLAAMIDRVDQEVGRLVDDLKANDEFDNTMILFVSDNGACPYDRKRPVLDVTPTNASQSLGDSTGWAWARNSPFRFYKQNQFEGGISTPAIVHWPAGLKTAADSITHQPAHLIDVLPTLADITGSEIPTTHAERDLRPISGVSLAPIFAGDSLGKRPPIHLQFQNDRGLRIGDWKLVSFRGKAWELYNVANDRAETNNVAGEHPERLAEMIAQWNEIATNTLHAPARMTAPANQNGPPHHHREWTKFDDERPDENRSGKQQKRSPDGPFGLRARKNTKLKNVDGAWHLTFTGDDPGIVLDLRRSDLQTGPYEITFRLQGGDTKGGDIYYTLDAKTPPLRGQHVRFPITGDTKAWQEIKLTLETKQRIHLLRIDPSAGIGKAVIDSFVIRAQAGQALQSK